MNQIWIWRVNEFAALLGFLIGSLVSFFIARNRVTNDQKFSTLTSCLSGGLVAGCISWLFLPGFPEFIGRTVAATLLMLPAAVIGVWRGKKRKLLPSPKV